MTFVLVVTFIPFSTLFRLFMELRACLSIDDDDDDDDENDDDDDDEEE